LRLTNSTAIIERCDFRNSELGLTVDEVSEIVVKQCLFYDNIYDIEHDFGKNTQILNNLFYLSENNLNLTDTDALIKHNNFQDSNYNIIVAGESEVLITLNSFCYNFRNIFLKKLSHEPFKVKPTITKCNFLSTSDYVIYQDTEAVPDTVYAEYNYWGTTSKTDIDLIIYDFHDNPDPFRMKIVDYEPYYLVPIDSAGILYQ
jgi:hypothetical protein